MSAAVATKRKEPVRSTWTPPASWHGDPPTWQGDGKVITWRGLKITTPFFAAADYKREPEAAAPNEHAVAHPSNIQNARANGTEAVDYRGMLDALNTYGIKGGWRNWYK